MIRGLGEMKQSGDSAKAESGGWTPENMSQVKFRGAETNRTEMRMPSPSERAAQMRAQQEKLAQMRAEVAKYAKSVDSVDAQLNQTVNRKTEQMGGGAVRLDVSTQQAPKKRFGLFGRR